MSFKLFYNNKTQINDLIEKYKQGKLVLVLGAGISKSFNIPDWNELLSKLLINHFKTSEGFNKEFESEIVEVFNYMNKDNELKKGRYIQSLYEKDKEPYALENNVRDTLYKETKIGDTSTIDNIVLLIQSLKVNSVITYNYDDILERRLYIKNPNFKVKSLHGESQDFNKDEFPIYHVHGFLPESSILNENNKITFGEKTYHDQYLDIYSSHNIIQITKFRENSCLFIGVSLRDPNTRRLLDLANKKEGHYIFRKNVNLVNAENNTSLQSVEDKEKSELLLKTRKLLNDYESIDAYSFGVNTIWIDEYDIDIPKILQKIVGEESILEQIIQNDIIKDIWIEDGLTKNDKYVKISLKVEKSDRYGIFIGDKNLQYIREKNFFHGLVNYTDNKVIISKIQILYI